MDQVSSVNDVPIRLPEERWNHIREQHGELASYRADILETVASPDRVVAGSRGERLALREVEPNKQLIVVYRAFEEEEDGFVITAYLTRRLTTIDQRKQLWP